MRADAVHPSLGIGVTHGVRYAKAWRISTFAYRPRDTKHSVLHAKTTPLHVYAWRKALRIQPLADRTNAAMSALLYADLNRRLGARSLELAPAAAATGKHH